MKFKPGNLYIITKEIHGTDHHSWGMMRPYCLKTNKGVDLKINDIFLFLEEYQHDGPRWPTNTVYKIFLNDTIFCIGAEEINKNGCKLVQTEKYKLYKNSVADLVKKSFKNLYTVFHVRIHSNNIKHSRRRHN